ncbi:MAG: putative polyprenol-phosphate-mannose synthase [Actinomycetota bacterium]
MSTSATGDPLARLRLGWRMLLAIVSGVLLALAFPPVGASLLAPLAVALFVIATYRTTAWRGALIGAIQGAVTFAILLRWMTVVGGDAWLLLVGLCAFWIAIVGAGQALVTRLRWWPLWVACVWVLQEALRDRIPLGGFPWGRLAFAQTATTLTPWAAIAGAPAVTFATALAGALIAFIVLVAVARRSTWRAWAAAGAGGLVVIALSGLLIPRPTDGQVDGGPASATAAVIQGGVPNTGLSVADERRDVFERHVAQTLRLATDVDSGAVPRPDVVIWPENAVDIDPFVDRTVADEITAAARAVAAPILVGAIIDAPGDATRIANVGIVWDPQEGPTQVYAKRHPVPFGEYIPFRSIIAPLVGRLDRVPRDMAPGQAAGVLQAGTVRLGDVICFEVAYDDVVHDAVTAGGRVLVVQTNNATFAGLGQPEQQVAMSRLRAVEHGRAVLVAATSGISAVISPDGAVVSEIGEANVGYLVESVPLRDTLTLADRLGQVPEWIVAALGLAAMVWAAVRRRGVATSSSVDA